jgi:hypothetical protein
MAYYMAPLSQHLPRRTQKSHECPIRITNPSAIIRKMGAPKCERGMKYSVINPLSNSLDTSLHTASRKEFHLWQRKKASPLIPHPVCLKGYEYYLSWNQINVNHTQLKVTQACCCP